MRTRLPTFKQLNFPRKIFVDRSLGGHRLPSFLRSIGFDVIAHKECSWLNSDADDDVWIPDVTARGWIILSSDRRISIDPVNVKAVRDSKAQVIVTGDNNMLPEFWGSAFVLGRIRINEVLQANPGPVFIRIGHCCAEHVKVIRTQATNPQAPKTKPPQIPKPVADFSYVKF